MKAPNTRRKFFSVFVLALGLILFFCLPIYLAGDSAVSEECSDFTEFNKLDWKTAQKIFYPLEAPIGSTTYVGDITEYLLVVYNFAVAAAGILAVTVIMFGGLSWAISAGNEQRISQAKETIISAIIGLILVLGSYVILNFISPQLTQFDINILEIPVNPAFDCPDLDESSLVDGTNDIIALNGKLLRSGMVSVGKVCPTMKDPINKIAYSLTIYMETNGKKDVTIRGSGWRSNKRQWELRMCFCNTKVGSGKCDTSCNGCVNCGACNPAAIPCKNAMHPQGLAMDVHFEGVGIEMSDKKSTKYNCAPPTKTNGSECSKFNGLKDLEQDLANIMTGQGVSGYLPTGLTGINSEWWHFQAKYATSCSFSNMKCTGLIEYSTVTNSMVCKGKAYYDDSACTITKPVSACSSTLGWLCVRDLTLSGNKCHWECGDTGKRGDGGAADCKF